MILCVVLEALHCQPWTQGKKEQWKHCFWIYSAMQKRKQFTMCTKTQILFHVFKNWPFLYKTSYFISQFSQNSQSCPHFKTCNLFTIFSSFEHLVMKFLVPFPSLWNFESVARKTVWSVFTFPSTLLFDSHDPMYDSSKWDLPCLHINKLYTSHWEFHFSWLPVQSPPFLGLCFPLQFYMNHTWLLFFFLKKKI